MKKRMIISSLCIALIFLAGCLSDVASEAGLTSEDLQALEDRTLTVADGTAVESEAETSSAAVSDSSEAVSGTLTSSFDITSSQSVISSPVIDSGAASRPVLSSSSVASSTGTTGTNATPIPDVDIQNNIELKITRIVPGSGVAQIYYTLRRTDGTFFEPRSYIDFEKFILSDESGRVLREGVGNNEFYNGPRCANNTESPVDMVEGSLTLETAKLQNVRRLVLTFRNMTIYRHEGKELGYNISDLFKQRPELVGQAVPLVPEATYNGKTYYQEPNLPKNNLNLRFDEASDFVISNMTITNGILLIRVDFDADRYMTGVPQFAVTENGQSMYMALSGVSPYDGNYTLVFPLSQPQGSTLVIQSVSYRKVLGKAGKTWTVGSGVDLSNAGTVLTVNKVVGGSVAGGKVPMFGTLLELRQITAGENSVSLELKESGTYTGTNEAGGNSCVYGKDGKMVFWKNVLDLQGPFNRIYLLESFTPDQLGAVVITKFYKDNSVDQYIFANFDFTAGTCNLYMIHDMTPEDSWNHLGTYIAGLYTGPQTSIAQ